MTANVFFKGTYPQMIVSCPLHHQIQVCCTGRQMFSKVMRPLRVNEARNNYIPKLDQMKQ